MTPPVEKSQIRTEMTLAIANEMCSVALDEASRQDALVSVAVVDGGGNLVCFARMDGAEIAGPTLAVDKAFTAVAHRIATEELATLAAPGGELFGLHSNGAGRYVIFAGGVPCWLGARVVGGIGVSGGSASQDSACAHAGLARWLIAEENQ